MIQSKSAYIAHAAKTILEQTEILKSAKLNKKQIKALQVIINLTGAVKEDAEFINNQLGEMVEEALRGGDRMNMQLEEGIPFLGIEEVPVYDVGSGKDMLILAKKIAKEHGNAFITSDKQSSDVCMNYKTIAVINYGVWKRLVVEK
jgi:hypothetical protein